MDLKEKEQLAQEQMEELRQALRDIDLRPKDLMITNPGAVGGSYGYESILSSGAADTITLSGPSTYNNTVTAGGYTITSGISANAGPYTVNTTGPGFTFSNPTASITGVNPWATTTSAGRMELTGDDADLVINGVSILDILEKRLNVMIPNPALEKEWDQLRALGDQYRALEADIKEKAEIWAQLNKAS
jgi:hypothetical protein